MANEPIKIDKIKNLNKTQKIVRHVTSGVNTIHVVHRLCAVLGNVNTFIFTSCISGADHLNTFASLHR